MNKVAEEMIDIFDLNTGSNSDNESNDYSSVAEDDSNEKPKFDELSEEVYDSIEGTDIDTPILESKKAEEPVDDNAENIDIKEPEEKKIDKVEEMIKESVSVSDEEQKDSGDDFDIDDIFSNSSSSPKEIPIDNSIEQEASINEDSAEDKEETPCAEEADTELIPEKALETTEEQPSEKDIPFDSAEKETGVEESPPEAARSEVNAKIEDNVRIINGKFQWLLNCPNEKFIPFYNAKAESLQDMLPGGQILFDKYTHDLRTATVNLTSFTSDLDELWDKMNTVQQHRERTVAIILHVDSQYYIWERFIDIMRGVLARRQYEKPILKQDGVVFIHMRDMELYYTKLRAIHHIGSSVLKNLDMAWETLSRRVTISMGDISREVKDRTHPKDTSKNKQNASIPSTPQKSPESDSSLDDFDELEGSTPIQSNEQPVGAQEIDW